MKSSFKKLIQNVIVSTIGVSMLFLLASDMQLVFAAVMTSTTYSIQSDSVNFGGSQGNSSIYRVEDTLGEIATGDSESTTYKIKAGYQQMVSTVISMTAAADVTMSPTLGGITGGTSNGSTATTITTDSSAGYELYIKASSSPAMQGNSQGDTIANYTPGAAPDFDFSVAASAAEFGFTPEGTDTAAEYLDNGTDTCNTGSTQTTDKCWAPVTTTNELIARRTSANSPSGTATTVKFRLTIGASAFKIEDTYTATTTLTAVSL